MLLCFYIIFNKSCAALLTVKFTPVLKGKKDRWVGGVMLASITQNVFGLPISYIQGLSALSITQSNKGTACVFFWLVTYVMVHFNCRLFQFVRMDFKFTRETDDYDLENKFGECSSNASPNQIIKNDEIREAKGHDRILINENPVLPISTTIQDETGFASSVKEKNNLNVKQINEASESQSLVQKNTVSFIKT